MPRKRLIRPYGRIFECTFEFRSVESHCICIRDDKLGHFYHWSRPRILLGLRLFGGSRAIIWPKRASKVVCWVRTPAVGAPFGAVAVGTLQLQRRRPNIRCNMD